jgi:hypothetical protein
MRAAGVLARCFNSLEFCAGGVDAPVSGSFPAVSRRTSPMRACTCAWTGLMNLESWSDRRDPLISRRSRLASEEERYVDCSYLGLNPHQERLTVRVVNVSAHQQQQQQKKAVENETRFCCRLGPAGKLPSSFRGSNVRAVAARGASSSPDSKQLVRRRCSQIRKTNEASCSRA